MNARITATLGCIAALGAGAAIATGQTPTQATTLTLAATPTGGSGLDLGRKGPSIGDEFFEHGKLAGDRHGHFQLVTQLVAGNGRHGTEQNQFSLRLSDGQIEVAGGHPTTNRFSMPVVGGTGAYEGAHGVMTVAPRKGQSETLSVTLDR